MPYFLFSEILNIGKTCEIVGDEARHILLSKRGRVGEIVKIQGADGKRYLAEIKDIDRSKLKLIPKMEISVPTEPKINIILFQAVVAEAALDTILQKATELAAAKIVLFNSERVATKLSQDRWQAKQDRWRKILLEAAKQSERAKPPELEFVLNFKELLKELVKIDKIFLADPSTCQNFYNALILNSKFLIHNSGIIIGPEGGLTDEENKSIAALTNCISVSLGPILLRADTAAIAMISITQSLLN